MRRLQELQGLLLRGREGQETVLPPPSEKGEGEVSGYARLWLTVLLPGVVAAALAAVLF